MIAFHLPPYLAYKPSGAEWLGDVPTHWEVARLKGHVANVTNLTNECAPDDTYIALENIESWTGRIREVGREVDFDSQVKRFQVGDVLFGKLRPYLAKVTSPNCKGVCVGEFLVLRCRGDTCLPSYLERLMRSKSVIDAVNASTFGAKMPRADWQFIGSMKYPFPPFSEQHAVSRYLDHVDRRIQRYIEAKEKLIARLQEVRQSIIQRAVTRCLDPDVPLKPSGVEWLGDVPAHWEIRRAKYLYHEVNERSSTGAEELMSVSHKTGVTPRKKNVTMFRAETNVGYKLCRPGDIVINTMWAYMAALGVARQVGLVSPSYNVYRPIAGEEMNLDYIDPLLRTETYRTEYLVRSTGITVSRLRLYPESFLDIPLLYPPVEEQAAIAAYLEKATADIDAAIDNARRQVEFMTEYRSSLIAHVVTGKLDVRAAAATLHDSSPIRDQ